jgi:hypothetical protein
MLLMLLILLMLKKRAAGLRHQEISSRVLKRVVTEFDLF